jgi:hypothetical protein
MATKTLKGRKMMVWCTPQMIWSTWQTTVREIEGRARMKIGRAKMKIRSVSYFSARQGPGERETRKPRRRRRCKNRLTCGVSYILEQPSHLAGRYTQGGVGKQELLQCGQGRFRRGASEAARSGIQGAFARCAQVSVRPIPAAKDQWLC